MTMTTTCDFTSAFFINSGCCNLVGKHANGEDSDVVMVIIWELVTRLLHELMRTTYKALHSIGSYWRGHLSPIVSPQSIGSCNMVQVPLIKQYHIWGSQKGNFFVAISALWNKVPHKIWILPPPGILKDLKDLILHPGLSWRWWLCFLPFLLSFLDLLSLPLVSCASLVFLYCSLFLKVLMWMSQSCWGSGGIKM